MRHRDVAPISSTAHAKSPVCVGALTAVPETSLNGIAMRLASPGGSDPSRSDQTAGGPCDVSCKPVGPNWSLQGMGGPVCSVAMTSV